MSASCEQEKGPVWGLVRRCLLSFKNWFCLAEKSLLGCLFPRQKTLGIMKDLPSVLKSLCALLDASLCSCSLACVPASCVVVSEIMARGRWWGFGAVGGVGGFFNSPASSFHAASRPLHPLLITFIYTSFCNSLHLRSGALRRRGPLFFFCPPALIQRGEMTLPCTRVSASLTRFPRKNKTDKKKNNIKRKSGNY